MALLKSCRFLKRLPGLAASWRWVVWHYFQGSQANGYAVAPQNHPRDSDSSDWRYQIPVRIGRSIPTGCFVAICALMILSGVLLLIFAPRISLQKPA